MTSHNYTCSTLRFGTLCQLKTSFCVQPVGATFESAAFKLKKQPSEVSCEIYGIQAQNSNFVQVVRNAKMDV